MDKILQECVMESEIDSGLRPLGCGFDGAAYLRANVLLTDFNIHMFRFCRIIYSFVSDQNN